MTAVHQDTGVIDKLGPLDVLRTYRAPAGPTHAMFGQLMLPLQVGGKVRVGDEVTQMDRKKNMKMCTLSVVRQFNSTFNSATF